MASNCTLLQSLSGDPEFEKQIGCMAGILQIFDRHQVLTGRRLIYGGSQRRIVAAEGGNNSSSYIPAGKCEHHGSSSPATYTHHSRPGESPTGSPPDLDGQIMQPYQTYDQERRHILQLAAAHQQQRHAALPSPPVRCNGAGLPPQEQQQKLLIRDVVSVSSSSAMQQHSRPNGARPILGNRTADPTAPATNHISNQRSEQQQQRPKISFHTPNSASAQQLQLQLQQAPQRLDSSRSLHEPRPNYCSMDLQVQQDRVLPRRSVDTGAAAAAAREALFKDLSSRPTPRTDSAVDHQHSSQQMLLDRANINLRKPIAASDPPPQPPTSSRPKFGAYCPVLQSQPENYSISPDRDRRTAVCHVDKPLPATAAAPPVSRQQRLPDEKPVAKLPNVENPTAAAVRSSADLSETLKLLAKLREIDSAGAARGGISAAGHNRLKQQLGRTSPESAALHREPLQLEAGAISLLSATSYYNNNSQEQTDAAAVSSSSIINPLIRQGSPRVYYSSKEVPGSNRSRSSMDSYTSSYNNNCRGGAGAAAASSAGEAKSQYSSCNTNYGGASRSASTCSNSDCDTDSLAPADQRRAPAFGSNVVARLMGLEIPHSSQSSKVNFRDPTISTPAISIMATARPTVAPVPTATLTTTASSTSSHTAAADANSGRNTSAVSPMLFTSERSSVGVRQTSRGVVEFEFEQEEYVLRSNKSAAAGAAGGLMQGSKDGHIHENCRDASTKSAAPSPSIAKEEVLQYYGGVGYSKSQQQVTPSTSPWKNIESSDSDNNNNNNANVPLYQPRNHRFMEDRTPSVLSSAVKLCAQIEEMQRKGSWQRSSTDPEESSSTTSSDSKHSATSAMPPKTTATAAPTMQQHAKSPNSKQQDLEALRHLLGSIDRLKRQSASCVTGSSNILARPVDVHKLPPFEDDEAQAGRLDHIRQECGYRANSRKGKGTTQQLAMGALRSSSTKGAPALGSRRQYSTSTATDPLQQHSSPVRSRDQSALLLLRRCSISAPSAAAGNSNKAPRPRNNSGGSAHQGRSAANLRPTVVGNSMDASRTFAGSRICKSGQMELSALSSSNSHDQQLVGLIVEEARHTQGCRQPNYATDRAKQNSKRPENSNSKKISSSSLSCSRIDKGQQLVDVRNIVHETEEQQFLSSAPVDRDHNEESRCCFPDEMRSRLGNSPAAAAAAEPSTSTRETDDAVRSPAAAEIRAAAGEAPDKHCDGRSSTRMLISSRSSFQNVAAAAHPDQGLLQEQTEFEVVDGVKRKLDFETEWSMSTSRPSYRPSRRPHNNHMMHSRRPAAAATADVEGYSSSTSSNCSNDVQQQPAIAAADLELELELELQSPRATSDNNVNTSGNAAADREVDVDRRHSGSAEEDLKLLAKEELLQLNEDTESQGDIKSTGSSCCDQPSPISVLDGPFCRDQGVDVDISSSPPQREIIFMDDAFGAELAVQDAADEARGEGMGSVADEENSCAGNYEFQQQEETDLECDAEAATFEYIYVKRVLDRAAAGGMRHNLKLAPLDPALFLLLEEEFQVEDEEEEGKCSASGGRRRRSTSGHDGMWKRKLLFDAVDASLRRMIRQWQCLQQQPWMLVNKPGIQLLQVSVDVDEQPEMWVGNGAESVLLQEVWMEIMGKGRGGGSNWRRPQINIIINNKSSDDDDDDDEDHDTTVERLLEEDQSADHKNYAWMVDAEKGEVATDIERLLFKDLMDHLLQDLTSAPSHY